MYQFRDPIHGFIEVSDLELKIIDSPPFQRLRNIKQLATTYLVYHGAEHTRFGHSLGVMHLVTRAFNNSLENYKKNTGNDLFDVTTKEWYLQILRLIGLTHDLGHAPFSHASEALFNEGNEHEDFTKKIICETIIADYIRDIGYDFVKNHNNDKKYNITPELLWLIYGEKKPEMDLRYIMPDFKFLKSFMDSELDCDKMDYLLRDSYYCGVNYGKFDLNKLLSSLSVYKKQRDNILQLAVERGGIYAFEEFVIARYFMFIQVYFHKTRRYLDMLLVKSIMEVLPNKKYPNSVDEYLRWDDDLIYDKIRESALAGSIVANEFINRQVKSCVYETNTHSDEKDKQAFKFVKRELERGLNSHLVEDEANKLAHKIPALKNYDSASSKGIPIIVDYSKNPTSIATVSILLRSLIEPIDIKRLYVSRNDKEKALLLIRNFIDVEDGENDG